MSMNRRNVLIGLGAVAAGGGAVLGSGAFSQVEAQRTVAIAADGDSSALVGLQPNTTLSSGAITETGGTLEVSLGDSTNGVNVDARTTVGELNDNANPNSVTTEAFTITNNSSNAINIDVAVNMNSAQSGENVDESVFRLYTDVNDNGATINGGNFGDITTSTLSGLPNGGSALAVVQVNTIGLDTSDMDTSNPLVDSVTITANSQ